MPWPAIVFGWPAIGGSLAVFALAFVRGRSSLAIAGAAIAAPFCWYVSQYPSMVLVGPVVFASNCVSAWLLHRDHRLLALAFLFPFVAIVIFLAVAVLGQGRHAV